MSKKILFIKATGGIGFSMLKGNDSQYGPIDETVSALYGSLGIELPIPILFL